MRRDEGSLDALLATGLALEFLRIQYHLASDRLVDVVRLRAGGRISTAC